MPFLCRQESLRAAYGALVHRRALHVQSKHPCSAHVPHEGPTCLRNGSRARKTGRRECIAEPWH